MTQRFEGSVLQAGEEMTCHEFEYCVSSHCLAFQCVNLCTSGTILVKQEGSGGGQYNQPTTPQKEKQTFLFCDMGHRKGNTHKHIKRTDYSALSEEPCSSQNCFSDRFQGRPLILFQLST